MKFKVGEIGQREIALRRQSQSATLNPSILVISLPIFYCRMVSLKGSNFDTKKSLLDAVRRGFPGSVSFAPGVKNEQIGMFWHWLVGQYDPAEGIKLYGTSLFGCHQDNYWS